MKISYETVYAGPLDTALDVLNSEELAMARAKKLELEEVTFRSSGSETETTIVVPQHKIPDKAQKFTPRGATAKILASTRQLDGGASISHQVKLSGIPVSISYQIVLADGGATTPAKVTGEFSVNIPFIGGKLEKFAAGKVDQLLDKDTAIVNTVLAGKH